MTVLAVRTGQILGFTIQYLCLDFVCIVRMERKSRTLIVDVSFASRVLDHILTRGTCYGNVSAWLAGWLGVCHTPVLYQNG